MIYLSSPYTHLDAWVREHRVLYTMKVVADLLRAGEFVYSPIVMCHELAKTAQLPVEHEFWLRFDNHMIDICDEFAILRIDGWESSRGMKAEYEHATRMGKRIRYI